MATNNSVNTPLSGTSGTGNFTGNNSPTLTTPKINQINDTSGNGALLFNATGSAVNFFDMTNATTGTNPILGLSGSDSNISMRIQPKGTGYLEVYTFATTGQIQWVSGNGSSYTHRSIHNLPTTAATTNYTWPDLSGTVALSGASQAVSFGNISTPQLNDTNNNAILNFSPTASAVNYLQIINNITGSAPVLSATGSDTNVNLQFNAKAQGAFSFYTTGTANQLIFNSGASYQHTTNLSFPSSSANRTVTFPDLTGTVNLGLATGGIGAWVNFNGTGTVAIRASSNVTSITDNGTGDYTVNFITSFSAATYAFFAYAFTTSGGVNRACFSNGDNSNTSQLVGSYRFYSSNLSGTPSDTDYLNCLAIS